MVPVIRGTCASARHKVVVIVSVGMIDILVDRDHIHVLQSDVNTQSGFAEPEEVAQLFRVRDVVESLQLAGRVEILQVDSSAVRFYPLSYDECVNRANPQLLALAQSHCACAYVRNESTPGNEC